MQSPAKLRITAHSLALPLSIYRVTAKFPRDERFGLTAQMRRAAVSIGSNIAEGCGGSGEREFVNFLHIALGSTSELEFQASVARDLGLLDVDTAPDVQDEINHLKRMLLRMITAVRSRADRTSTHR